MQPSATSNPTEPMQLDLLPTVNSIQPVSIRTKRVLGHGRAAEARLVEVTTQDGTKLQCVEKVFCPGRLTRAIYRLCFQSSFAYQHNQNAIKAAFYRRRVAWAMCRVYVPQADVARPLYVRWDSNKQALVLASQWIAGRGIIPQAADPLMIRRQLLRTAGTVQVETITPAPPEELQELLAVMRQLEQLFIESGLVGTGWQVSQRALVSTANLLRMPEGYVCIDLESGIPSVLVTTYLAAGIRLGSMPLFDDLDGVRLRQWVADHRQEMSCRLTQDQIQQFDQDLNLLIEHTNLWKLSEPAVFRRPFRLTTQQFSQLYKQQVIRSWAARRIIDQQCLQQMLEPSTKLLRSAVYWLGWIPGSTGRFLQRCLGNLSFRDQVSQFFRNQSFRKQACQQWIADEMNDWKSSQRISPAISRTFSRTHFGIHWLLSRLTPPRIHRWLTDSQIRQDRLTRLALLCVSPSFQCEFGRLLLRNRLRDWFSEQRLTEPQWKHLSYQLGNPAIEEYVRGFGMHVGLKLLLPLLLPLKAVGAAASIASGNPFYFLIVLMALPMLRTAVTLWRMMASRRPVQDFRDALLVGALPTVGTLAFPLQMHSRSPELSTFLMRDFAAQVGRRLPIYGGKDSRTELALIKSVNVFVELIDIWLKLVRSRPVELSIDQATAANNQPKPSVRMTSWDRAATRQLAQITLEFGLASDSFDGRLATGRADVHPAKAA